MVCRFGEILASHCVDAQAQGHADGGRAEAPVEPLAFLQPAGDQRADQPACVDAHVEDGEAGVAAFVLLSVQAAHQRGGVGLEPAGADAHQHQAGDEAGNARQERQRNVACHDQDGRAEQDPFRTEEPVSQPGAKNGGEVDSAAVGAHQPCGQALLDFEAALRSGEVHVVEEDALHAVEGEALPHFHGEEAGQHLWVAKKGSIARRCSGAIG